MIFYRITQKIKKFYEVFIAPPWRWSPPKNVQILIYDAAGAEFLTPYLADYTVAIMAVRAESVHVPCFLRACLKPAFWKGKVWDAYTDSYIQAVSPKLILSFIDNDPNFYRISKIFPTLKTAFVQNGIRSVVGDVFGVLTPSDNYHVDYMLVHNRTIGEYYKKFISGEYVVIGSLKNNSIDASKNSTDGSVLFVSQYRPKPNEDTPLFIEPDGSHVYYSQFYSCEIQVLGYLKRWCTEHSKLLKICAMSTESSCPERDFYDEMLNGCAWEYVPRSDYFSSYKLIDSAEIVVFIDSTLGTEALSRGKKVAAFSCRMALPGQKTAKLGWPVMLPDTGPFWTSDADDEEFRRILNYLNTVSDDDWGQTRKRYAAELMEFDPGNTRLKSLLEQLLPKADKQTYAQ